MDPLVVVSPHLDDAVLGAGQFLAGYPGATILTVFAGMPPADAVLSTFDEKCGFETPQGGMVARLVEDERALRLMAGAIPMGLSFVDHQYQPRTTEDVEQIAEQIAKTIADVGANRVVFPLGLDHPDHMATSDACLSLIANGHPAVFHLYEELPHRVERPESAFARLAEVRGRGFTLELTFIGTGPRQQKQRALREYKSQRWALDEACCLAPERFWLVQR